MANDPCRQCKDGWRRIKWVIVKDVYYPLFMNYLRDDDGAIRRSVCKRVLRKGD
jgi:hypothetical protein